MSGSILYSMAALSLFHQATSQVLTQVVSNQPSLSVTSLLTMTGLDGQKSTITHILGSAGASGTISTGGTGLPSTNQKSTIISSPIPIVTTSPVSSVSNNTALLPHSLSNIPSTSASIPSVSGAAGTPTHSTGQLTSSGLPEITDMPGSTALSGESGSTPTPHFGQSGPTSSGPGAWTTSAVILTATDGHTTNVDYTATSVTYSSTQSGGGAVIPIPTVAWACVGPLCDPGCLIPLLCPGGGGGGGGGGGFPPPTPPSDPLSPDPKDSDDPDRTKSPSLTSGSPTSTAITTSAPGSSCSGSAVPSCSATLNVFTPSGATTLGTVTSTVCTTITTCGPGATTFVTGTSSGTCTGYTLPPASDIDWYTDQPGDAITGTAVTEYPSGFTPTAAATKISTSPAPGTTSHPPTTLVTSVSPQPTTTAAPTTTTPPPTTAPPPVTTPPPPSPTVAPVNPANTDHPECAPLPTGHIFDSHEGQVKKAASYFASNYAQQIIPFDQGPVNETHFLNHGLSDNPFNNDDLGDDQFVASIISVDECVVDAWNLGEPLTGVKCEDLMYAAWKNCFNHGRGGSVTAGCLKFTFGTYIQD